MEMTNNPTYDLKKDESEMEIETWIVQEEEASTRIDKFIVESIEAEVSRTMVQQWIRDACVLVNGRSVKPNYTIQIEDHIELKIPDAIELEAQAEDIPLDVIYEDKDMIVINKPRGMVVHPAPGHYSGTLVHALLHHCKDLSGINGVMRPGIVHRIDKDTSGLIMIAKNDHAHASLAQQLKDRTVTRKYIALVHGKVEHDVGTIDAPIGRDPRDRKLYTVIAQNSKSAVTHFQVIDRFSQFSWMELRLETGRTHQIRVHMKYIGHPLVGDPAYGTGSMKHNLHFAGGQALHAQLVSCTHPRTGEYMEFTAPIPEDMQHVFNLLTTQE